METRVQFKDVESGVSKLKSTEDAFVPEMSLPIKDILNQFAFVDNMRLADYAKQGFEYADTNEDDFEVEEFDRLDPAEKEELFNRASDIVTKYENFRRKQQEQHTSPSVDEEQLP